MYLYTHSKQLESSFTIVTTITKITCARKKYTEDIILHTFTEMKGQYYKAVNSLYSNLYILHNPNCSKHYKMIPNFFWKY